MSSRYVALRYFKCSACGAIATAPKMRRTGNEHIKHMYCPVCRDTTEHRQFDMEKVRKK